MQKQYWVYILADRPRGRLYTGVTSNLPRRVALHRAGVLEGFTKRYGIKRLVYFESFDDPMNAIEREKRIKRWRRPWKFRMIESVNPEWRDLYDEIVS